jgi:IS30 family transposase
LVERKSKMVRLAQVTHNTAERVAQALNSQLQSLVVRTIIREHELNKNTNSLVRQYFPKRHETSAQSISGIKERGS